MKYLLLVLFFASASLSAHQVDTDCETHLGPLPASPPPDSLRDAHLKAYRNGQLTEYMLRQGGIATILESLNDFANGGRRHTAHDLYFSVIVAKDWTLASRPEGEAKVRILRGFAPKIYAESLKRLKFLSDSRAIDSNEGFYLTQIAGMMITEAMQKHDPNEAAAIAKILKLSMALENQGADHLNALIFGRWNLATHESQRARLIPSIQEVVIDDDPKSFISEAERDAALRLIKKHTKLPLNR